MPDRSRDQSRATRARREEVASQDHVPVAGDSPRRNLLPILVQRLRRRLHRLPLCERDWIHRLCPRRSQWSRSGGLAQLSHERCVLRVELLSSGLVHGRVGVGHEAGSAGGHAKARSTGSLHAVTARVSRAHRVGRRGTYRAMCPAPPQVLQMMPAVQFFCSGQSYFR